MNSPGKNKVWALKTKGNKKAGPEFTHGVEKRFSISISYVPNKTKLNTFCFFIIHFPKFIENL